MIKKAILSLTLSLLCGSAMAQTCKALITNVDNPRKFGELIVIRALLDGKPSRFKVEFSDYRPTQGLPVLTMKRRNGPAKDKFSAKSVLRVHFAERLTGQAIDIDSLKAGQHSAMAKVTVTCIH